MRTTELKQTVPQVGRVEWIGTAAEKRGEIRARDAVEVTTDGGLEGEHHSGGAERKRQVTLIQAEHLAVIGQLLGRDAVDPARLRRNVVVSGINLLGLRDLRFRVGDVLLEGTGPCPPCGRIEENLGEGGYQAARGHAGISARVIEAGELRVGDEVRAVAND